jgi:hypothetical protein
MIFMKCVTYKLSVILFMTASVVWGLACWPLVPEFAGSRAQTRPKPLDFSHVKILSMPSFGQEVK